MKIIDELMEYLATEGLRPQKEDYGIFFRFQMLNFAVFWDEDDDHFLRISIPNIFDVDENNRIDALTVSNTINMERKVVKALVTDNSVWISAEQLLDQDFSEQKMIETWPIRLISLSATRRNQRLFSVLFLNIKSVSSK